VFYDDEYALQGFGLADGNNVVLGAKHLSVYRAMQDDPTYNLESYMLGSSSPGLQNSVGSGIITLSKWITGTEVSANPFIGLVINILKTTNDAIVYHVEMTPWYLHKSEHFKNDLAEFFSSKESANDFATRSVSQQLRWREHTDSDSNTVTDHGAGHYIIYNAGPSRNELDWRDYARAYVHAFRYAWNHDIWVAQEYVDGVLGLFEAIIAVLGDPEELKGVQETYRFGFDNLFSALRKLNDDIASSVVNGAFPSIDDILLAFQETIDVGDDPIPLISGAFTNTSSAILRSAADQLSAYLSRVFGPLFEAPKVSIGGANIAIEAVANVPFGPRVTLSGALDLGGDFHLENTQNFSIGDLNVTSGKFVLDRNTGLTFTGSADFGFFTSNIHGTIQQNGHTVLSASGSNPMMGSYSLSGTITNGKFTLSGTGSIEDLGGIRLKEASFTVTQAGMSIESKTNIRDITDFSLRGMIQRNGSFSLTGSGSMTLNGLKLVGVSATLANNGLSISGKTNVANLSAIGVSGKVQSNGHFDLTGSGSVVVDGYKMINVDVSLNYEGVRVDGRLNISNVGIFNVAGLVEADGSFELKGSGSIELEDYRLSGASITLNNDGLQIDARTDIPGVSDIKLSGNIDSNGDFKLTGKQDIKLAGYSISEAKFTLVNSGLTFTGKVKVKRPWPLSDVTKTITGSVSPSGVVKVKI
jgi:hypothetical protein